MLRAPVRDRCVARKLSASVITVLAEPAAEPISASIQTATMTSTWPSCRLRRTSVLEPRHRLRVERDRARDAKQRVEDRLPLQLQVDDHQLMSGCAYCGPTRPCACRTAPARIRIARA